MKKYLPFLPVCIIVLAMILIYFSDLKDKLTFDTIHIYRDTWKAYTSSHPFISALIFIATLTLSVCFIIPDSIPLGILAGFLFPLPLAILYITFAETLGAYLFFEAIRIAFIPPLHRRKKSFIWKLEERVQKNQISYLLFFRFTHLMPFWIINTAAACFEIKRWTFIWTAAVGMLPFAYAVAQGGSALDTFFENNAEFSLNAIFNDKVKPALLGLGILAIMPIILKIFKKKWLK